MIIETDDGQKITCKEAPHWNEYWKRWYVWGQKWIKTKKKYSSNTLLHNFKSYKEVTA